MPIQTVVTADDLDGIVNDTDLGNTVIVRQNVLVSWDAGNAIRFGAGLSYVQVSGMVAAVNGSAIALGVNLGTGQGSNAVTVAEGGVVASNFGVGINLSGIGGGNSVINAGMVSSLGGAAVQLVGDFNSVTNSGTLASFNQTVFFSASPTSTNWLSNSGVIAARSADSTAFLSFEGRDEVINTGLISGRMDFFAGGDQLDNEGGIVTGRIDFGAGDDELAGGGGRERAIGGTGNDVLEFAGGNDVFIAGNSDSLPSDGDDDVDGGDGIDTYDASGAVNAVTIRLHEQRAVGTEIGRDLVVGVENATGGGGNDTLVGDAGRNVLRGSSGLDTLNGLEGSDRLSGGGGNDWLIGNAGRDVMTGGANFDLFDFNNLSDSLTGDSNRDIITDFAQGFDLIDLSTLDASTAVGGNQAFVFIGVGAFTGVAGQLRFSNSASAQYTTVEGDVNGDGAADLSIGLFGNVIMVVSDFVL